MANQKSLIIRQEQNQAYMNLNPDGEKVNRNKSRNARCVRLYKGLLITIVKCL